MPHKRFAENKFEVYAKVCLYSVKYGFNHEFVFEKRQVKVCRGCECRCGVGGRGGVKRGMHRTRRHPSQLVMIELIKLSCLKLNRLFSVLIDFQWKIHFDDNGIGEIRFRPKWTNSLLFMS